MLREASERYVAAKAESDAAYEDVVAKVLEALEAGERPIDVADASPFKEAWVRRLARNRGAARRPPGPRRPRTDDTSVEQSGDTEDDGAE